MACGRSAGSLVVAALLGLTACPSGAARPLSVNQTPQASPTLGVARPDTLAAGDVMDVRIFGEPDLTGSVKVRADGTVALPLVGRVEVAGMTADQAAEAIRRAYANGFLASPEVTVTVTAFNSKRFYVMGAVGKPGVFPYDQDMNVLRAIILAGGFAPTAQKNGVLITRTVNGVEVRMEVAVDDIGQGREKNVSVLPGDIIYVPTSIL